MTSRLILLRKNRELILKTLKHVQNVTNLGIKLIESPQSIAISLPDELISIPGVDNRSFIRTGAQLVFTQNPNDGIKVRHKMPQVRKPGEPLTGEIVNVIPPSDLNREVIFEMAIGFLERINEMRKTESLKYKP